MDREEISGNPLLALCNFGDHALHHLFPTLDSGILPALYDVFFETLLDFEVDYQMDKWFFEMIKGKFEQMARNTPQKFNSHQKFLLKYGKRTQSY